jgi:hypothetical protein
MEAFHDRTECQRCQIQEKMGFPLPTTLQIGNLEASQTALTELLRYSTLANPIPMVVFDFVACFQT